METGTTPAARTLFSVMDEENWNRKDIAAATGMDYKTVLRWLSGESNPPSQRIADVLLRLGRDPKVYGINTPRATPLQLTDDPPKWAVKMQNDITNILKILERS